MAGGTRGCWWQGLCGEGCHSACGLETWYLCLFACSRCWQKGNTQYASVWKHVLLSHFVFYFCGYEFLEHWAYVSHFPLASGAGEFTQLQAMAFTSIPSSRFLPSCWICFTYAACPQCACTRSAGSAGSRRGPADVSCLSHGTRHRRDLLQVWDVPGTCGASCKRHPWSLGSTFWFVSQVAIAERGEIQQLRHSLLWLDILRSYF